MTHHPSCKPTDRSLLYVCKKCGLTEAPTIDIESELDRVRKERDSWKIQCEMALESERSAESRLAVLMQEVHDEAVETQEYFKKCNELEQQLREARENADRWNKEGIELARKMAEIAGLYHAAQRAIERKDRALISMRTYAESMKGGKGLIVESYFDFFERECIKALPPIDPAFPKSTEPDSTHGAKCKVPEPPESAERGKANPNCEMCEGFGFDSCGYECWNCFGSKGDPSLPEGRAGKENS